MEYPALVRSIEDKDVKHISLFVIATDSTSTNYLIRVFLKGRM